MSPTTPRRLVAGAAFLAALATGACQTSYKSNNTGIGLTGGVRAEAVTRTSTASRPGATASPAGAGCRIS